MWQCPNYLALNLQGRSDFVTKQQRCNNCLSRNHHQVEFQSTRICAYCNSKHHSSLCNNNNQMNNPPCLNNNNNATTAYASVVTSTSAGNSTLQTNVLSMVPVKTASLAPHTHMWLDVVAVEIRNSMTGQTKSIYASHDTSSRMTLL